MTEATQNNVEQTVEAAKPKLTRLEKLTKQYADLYAKYTKVLADLQEVDTELKGIQALANIGQGSAVVISVGKGDTAKDVDGIVLAVKDDEDGPRSYKVQYGSGFDTDIAVVKAGRIKLPAAATEAAPTAEGAAQGGDAFFQS